MDPSRSIDRAHSSAVTRAAMDVDAPVSAIRTTADKIVATQAVVSEVTVEATSTRVAVSVAYRSAIRATNIVAIEVTPAIAGATVLAAARAAIKTAGQAVADRAAANQAGIRAPTMDFFKIVLNEISTAVQAASDKAAKNIAVGATAETAEVAIKIAKVIAETIAVESIMSQAAEVRASLLSSDSPMAALATTSVNMDPYNKCLVEITLAATAIRLSIDDVVRRGPKTFETTMKAVMDVAIEPAPAIAKVAIVEVLSVLASPAAAARAAVFSAAKAAIEAADFQDAYLKVLKNVLQFNRLTHAPVSTTNIELFKIALDEVFTTARAAAVQTATDIAIQNTGEALANAAIEAVFDLAAIDKAPNNALIDVMLSVVDKVIATAQTEFEAEVEATPTFITTNVDFCKIRQIISSNCSKRRSVAPVIARMVAFAAGVAIETDVLTAVQATNSTAIQVTPREAVLAAARAAIEIAGQAAAVRAATNPTAAYAPASTKIDFFKIMLNEISIAVLVAVYQAAKNIAVGAPPATAEIANETANAIAEEIEPITAQATEIHESFFLSSDSTTLTTASANMDLYNKALVEIILATTIIRVSTDVVDGVGPKAIEATVKAAMDVAIEPAPAVGKIAILKVLAVLANKPTISTATPAAAKTNVDPFQIIVQATVAARQIALLGAKEFAPAKAKVLAAARTSIETAGFKAPCFKALKNELNQLDHPIFFDEMSLTRIILKEISAASRAAAIQAATDIAIRNTQETAHEAISAVNELAAGEATPVNPQAIALIIHKVLSVVKEEFKDEAVSSKFKILTTSQNLNGTEERKI